MAGERIAREKLLSVIAMDVVPGGGIRSMVAAAGVHHIRKIVTTAAMVDRKIVDGGMNAGGEVQTIAIRLEGDIVIAVRKASRMLKSSQECSD